jgi:prephenate dehydratase
MQVAIQGIRGAFHEEAAVQFFGAGTEIVPCMRFDDLVNRVANGNVEFGAIAVENTISGTLNQNLMLIAQGEVSIIGEVSLRIHQNLGALPGQALKDIKEVMSHHMALHQCRQFLSQHPHIRLVEVDDTALAAKRVGDEKLTGVGAIASRSAMDYYGLDIIAGGIETNHTNHTRFFMITGQGRSSSSATPDKCSMILTIPSVPGSLYAILGIFARAEIDLTKIESIPIENQPYHYAFVIDFTFHSIDQVKEILPLLQEATEDYKILGFYNASQMTA